MHAILLTLIAKLIATGILCATAQLPIALVSGTLMAVMKSQIANSLWSLIVGGFVSEVSVVASIWSNALLIVMTTFIRTLTMVWFGQPVGFRRLCAQEINIRGLNVRETRLGAKTVRANVWLVMIVR